MPTKDEFIRYAGPAEIHDSTFVGFRKAQDDSFIVDLKTYERADLSIEFLGVSDINHTKPEGMFIYALSEVAWPGDMKRYIFANSDESSSSRFEITCKEIKTKT